jgi:hypothetical protein
MNAVNQKRLADAEHKVLAFMAAMIDCGYLASEIWEAIDLTATKLNRHEKLWLWRDGKDRFVAFRSLFPTMPDGGDPATIGQPSGYAYYHRMTLTEAQAVSREHEQEGASEALPD